jgi:hypothetical protein
MLYSKPDSIFFRDSPLSDRDFPPIAFSPQPHRHVSSLATPVVEAVGQSILRHRWFLFLGCPTRRISTHPDLPQPQSPLEYRPSDGDSDGRCFPALA